MPGAGTPFFGALPIGSAGLVASTQIKTTAGRVHWVQAYNANAAQRFLQIHDVAATPADGAVPAGPGCA